MTNTPGPDRRLRSPNGLFSGVCAVLFVASAAVTYAWGAAMSAMAGMPMPGGWTMSMTWMRMPGQSWPGAAASFLAMWVVMMTAMMLPSLAPMLSRYRAAVSHGGDARLGAATAIVATAYALAWTGLGCAVFVVGDGLAAKAMQWPGLSRAMPPALGVVVLIAGASQFTAWKAHHLSHCRSETGPTSALPADIGAAWRHGLRLGSHCICSSAGLTAVLLVCGVMDLRAMTVVALATTAERLVPSGQRVAHAIGIMALAAGTFVVARATGAV